MNKTVVLTDSNFDQVLTTTKPVLIDFWAEWCGPCKMIGPMIEELANDYADRAVIAKLNVDENPVITARLGLRSVPALLIFKNGMIVDKHIGVVPRLVLQKKLEAQVGAEVLS